MNTSLFVYGTLMDSDTVRRLTGKEDIRYIEHALLPGFRRISRSIIIPLAPEEKDETVFMGVEGKVLLDLTPEELVKLDSYEGHPQSWRRESHLVVVGASILGLQTRMIDVYIPQGVMLPA